MSFNINQFKSTVDSLGIMRTNKFLVDFPVPRKIAGTVPQAAGGRNLSLYCKAAPLPGLGILTQDIYRYGMGPIERRPYGVVVNDIMFQFYVDGENMIRNWFRNWVRLILNPDSTNGVTSKWAQTGQSWYEFSYKEDYAVDIRITTFDQEGFPVISIVLVEAYPNFIGDIQQDWQEKHQHMIMPVAFTFRDWYEEPQLGLGSRNQLQRAINSLGPPPTNPRPRQ